MSALFLGQIGDQGRSLLRVPREKGFFWKKVDLQQIPEYLHCTIVEIQEFNNNFDYSIEGKDALCS